MNCPQETLNYKEKRSLINLRQINKKTQGNKKEEQEPKTIINHPRHESIISMMVNKTKKWGRIWSKL